MENVFKINEECISDKVKQECIEFIITNDIKLSLFTDKDGNIDFVGIISAMEEMKDKKYLDMHKFAVTQITDGRWQTYLPKEGGGRKQVRKSDITALEREIIDYYKQIEEVITIERAAYEWLKFKQEQPGFTGASYDRYENQYKRVFKELGNMEKVITVPYPEITGKDSVKINRTIPLKIINGVKTTIWAVSDDTIATVKDGVVKGIKPGIVTITAENNGYVMTKEVTIVQ